MSDIPQIFPHTVPHDRPTEEEHGIPVASMHASSPIRPTRRRRRRTRSRRTPVGQMRTTADRVVVRPEPPELDIEKELTEGIEGAMERLELIVKVGELPPSPYYRAHIYRFMEGDLRKMVGDQMKDILADRVSEYMSDSDRTVLEGTMRCIQSALWLMRYAYDFRIKIKKATTAEGQLGKEAQADVTAHSINPVRMAMARWFETMDAHWKAQREAYGGSLLADIMTETIILWLMNGTAMLCRTGMHTILSDPSAVEDFCQLNAFQDRYPSVGLMVGSEGVPIARYDQDTLMLALETLVEHWYETPWSDELVRYVELLYRRYVILACTKFRVDGDAVMNRPGMFHQSAHGTTAISPSLSKGATFYDMGLTFENIDPPDPDDEEEEEGGQEGPDIFHISEEYVTFGEGQLASMVLQIGWLTHTVFPSVDCVRRPAGITAQQFMAAMTHFVGYLKKTVDGRGTREFIKYRYRDLVFDYLLRPGEAVRFRRTHPLDTFSPENIISVMRRDDIDRIDKYILSVDIRDIVAFYAGEFTPQSHPDQVLSNPDTPITRTGGGTSLSAILQSMGSSENPDEPIVDEEMCCETDSVPPFGFPENAPLCWAEVPLRTNMADRTFTDSWSAWAALQHVCINNFFVCSDFHKKWDDIMCGHGHDETYEPRFIMEHFREITPTLACPYIFRVAGSFMVYLPWSRTVLWDDAFLYYEGAVGAAFYVAMKEMRQKLDSVQAIIDSGDASIAVIEETELLGAMTDACLAQLFGEVGE